MKPMMDAATKRALLYIEKIEADKNFKAPTAAWPEKKKLSNKEQTLADQRNQNIRDWKQFGLNPNPELP